ncbi:S1 family peptidase [Sphingomonas sp. Leaf67]|uniref:S1 family peptidase n=1 Tax=Sphingomonas sp. Leaf67 TaxID=1736230 RepID=UPI000B21550F|nr:S1 family peptidase [Sphingomonas sp. Leaf67]
MLRWMVAALAMVAGYPVAAQDAATIVSGEAALAQDAAEVARLRGIDPAAALILLRKQVASIAATDWIEGRYRDRLTGVAIEPDGAVSVLLTGNRPVADGEVRAGDLVVPVRFRIGAKSTRVELLDALNRHQAAIRAMLTRPPAIGVDARQGALLVQIGTADAAGDVTALRRRIADLTGVPIRIATTGRPDLDLTGEVIGGSRLIGPDPVTGRRYYCTTGFVVTDGAQTGIVTAAHCPNQLDHIGPDRSVTPTTFVGQWGWGFHDVQVNATPQAARPLFFADAARTQIRTVEGQRSRAATRVGDIVCHRGENSGYSCAEVMMVDFAPSGDLCGGPCLPTWVAVAGSGCRGGDSGGPVFLGGIAIGLLKGASYRPDRSCVFYYYMSLDYLPEGWRLLVGPPIVPPN